MAKPVPYPHLAKRVMIDLTKQSIPNLTIHGGRPVVLLDSVFDLPQNAFRIHTLDVGDDSLPGDDRQVATSLVPPTSVLFGPS